VMVIFNRGDDAATVDMQRYAQRIGASTNGVDVVSGRRYSVTRDLVMEPRSVLILELETR
nr:cyclomaltodextrinase C-terminal domain-containing protein [Woeseiaceae bacterium]